MKIQTKTINQTTKYFCEFLLYGLKYFFKIDCKFFISLYSKIIRDFLKFFIEKILQASLEILLSILEFYN
ncbi:hypothetical protein BKH42_08570 [Helicobacter sp. 13S00482-2]|nr:hypothetical protein BKH42_08570 [Helicobacter sp. 13S00482-2]